MKELKARVVNKIDLPVLGPGCRSKLKLNLISNALGEHWQIPVMLLRGHNPGPILGITAAIHGNELNGLPIIHKLFQQISPEKFSGVLMAVPILNIPGFLQNRREFSDGRDLNRLMPGNPRGTSAERYAFELFQKIIKKCDYIIDLHTASFGRVNSLYVRADMSHPVMRQMALLQEPSIIVNNPGEEGTLRWAAARKGINTITVEVGDPLIFQKKHIRPSIFGIWNVLVDLKMLDEEKEVIQGEPVICRESFWLYADYGGILEVFPQLTSFVKKGEVIARISDVFGKELKKVKSPADAYVVAKSTNPVCDTGARIIHLGLPK